MTKSTITREESIQAVFDLKVGYRLGFADIEILKRVARMALAAMDSEPVAYIFKHPAGRLFWSLTDESNKGHDDVMPVYASPQPAPVVPEEKSIPNTLSMYAVDAVAAIAEVKGWNACRAAMLAAAPQSPGSEPAAVPGKWIPVSERMPEDDDFVYIWPRPDFGVELHVGQYCERSHKGGGWYAQVYEQNYGIEWHPITVTHWMPLPNPPKEEK
ncbi:DUF551 domain-containing protein [Klebsiella pneumoniae]|nr:DUF551 domain-containing protein [Klebsiella pneumoniae]MCD9676338.1 DUF551 domain-containing protein [Klebsiella pneumoniae]MCD9972826.1 DUF551 domain-containing protein [Klebsiella pneumoniae]MCE0327195.1 DUF551 domain-containing protein [Klebsiella pneumoniae]